MKIQSFNLLSRRTPGPRAKLVTDEFRQDGCKLVSRITDPALYQTLYQTVEQLAYTGIPGCAGVASAKVAIHDSMVGSASNSCLSHLAYCSYWAAAGRPVLATEISFGLILRVCGY